MGKLTKHFFNKEPIVKWVKKANGWCRTSWPDGKQKTEFFSTEEEAKEEIKK